MAASKIYARVGTLTQLYNTTLDVGEIAYITDIRAAAIGDGSANPPLFMSTKSSGNFDFSSTTLVKFNQISATSYNGLNLAQLNANTGILVNTAPNTFTTRSITSGDNSITIANPAGTNGNMDIRVSSVLNLSSSTDGIILPQGTQAQRGVGVIGKLRYCNDPTDPYRCPEIYSADGTWHAIKEFVYNATYTLTVGTDYSTIEQCLLRHCLVDASGYSQINIPEGVYSAPQNINLSNFSQGKNWYFGGIIPQVKNILGISSISGSSRNWSVVVSLTDVTNINVGNYMLIDSLRGYSPLPLRGYVNTTAGSNSLITTTTTTNFNITSDYAEVDFVTNFAYDLRVGDYISMCSPITSTANTVSRFYAQIQSIPSSQLAQMTTNAPYSIVGGVAYSHFGLTGTVYASGNNVTGIGTRFTTQVNLNDVITVNDYMYTVTAINSDTSLTLNSSAVGWPTGAGSATQAYSNNNIELHCNCWKITAVDTVNKLVTILNTSINLPPLYNVGTGTCKIMKSVITFANPNSDGFTVNFNNVATFQDLVITSATGTGVIGIMLRGGAANVNDCAFIGFGAGSGLMASKGSHLCAFNLNQSLCFSNCSTGISSLAFSSVNIFNQVLINGGSGAGISITNSSVAVQYNSLVPWKSPLSILECYTGIQLANGAIFGGYTANIGFCTGSSINTGNGGQVNLSVGGAIHDNAGSIFISSYSYANMTSCRIYGQLYNVNYGVYAVQVRNSSTVILDSSVMSNNNVAALLGEGSTLSALNATLTGTYQMSAVVQSGSSLIALNANIQNPGTGNSNTTGIVSTDGSYASLAGGTLNVPNTMTAARANNGAFINMLATTLTTSTTLSPAKNTVGNSNSYNVN